MSTHIHIYLFTESVRTRYISKYEERLYLYQPLQSSLWHAFIKHFSCKSTCNPNLSIPISVHLHWNQMIYQIKIWKRNVLWRYLSYHYHTSSYDGNSSGKTEPADIIKLPSILVTKQLLFALLGVQNNTLQETEVTFLSFYSITS